MRQRQTMRHQGRETKAGLGFSKQSVFLMQGRRFAEMDGDRKPGWRNPRKPLSPEMCGGWRTLLPALIPQESGTALKWWVCSP